MVPEDMQILVMGQMGSDEVTGCLIDPMPGGSGLLEQLVVRFQEIRDEAIKIVQTCPSACQTSCTDCLQTYRNAFYHPQLDRHRALQFLESSGPQMKFARTVPAMHYGGTAPAGEKSTVNAAERRLRAMLTVRLDLRKQRLRRTPVLLATVCIGFERLFHRLAKRSQLNKPLTPTVPRRRRTFRTSQPPAYRIAR